jgi:phosphate transport system substrate-binding protein
MKRAKHTIVILSLALAGCRGTVYTPTTTPQTFSVRILTTTTTAPLLSELAAAYSGTDTRLVVTSDTASWPTLYTRVQAGDVPFALTSFVPDDVRLWAAPVGQDGIALVTHQANPVTALSTVDLRRVFMGQVDSWAALGGPALPVVVVSRELEADIAQVFARTVLHDRRVTLDARLALSGSRVVEIVSQNEGAIGYISMARSADLLAGQPVRVLALTGDAGGAPVLPSPDTVAAGQYPLPLPVLIIGPQPPAADSVYWRWFAWMQSEAGQQVIGQRYGRLKY